MILMATFFELLFSPIFMELLANRPNLFILWLVLLSLICWSVLFSKCLTFIDLLADLNFTDFLSSPNFLELLESPTLPMVCAMCAMGCAMSPTPRSHLPWHRDRQSPGGSQCCSDSLNHQILVSDHNIMATADSAVVLLELDVQWD